MAENEADKNPQPVEQSDAERVGPGGAPRDEQASAEEIERDPAYSPEEETLRDVKGG